MKKINQKIKSAGPKTFSHMGHWVEKKTRSEILICVCKSKYIKTRVGQTSCIKCMCKPVQILAE